MPKKKIVVIKRKKRHFLHKFILDGLANYIFFTPVFIVLNAAPFFLGLTYWSVENALTYAATAIFGSFILGGVFGRVLNLWRKKLNYH